MPAPDSELAQQLVRDPYVFDHLALSERAAERELEQALMARLQQTLLAFGHGMAFVGRQVRFDVDGDELVLDPLLFHVDQLGYVVEPVLSGLLMHPDIQNAHTCDDVDEVFPNTHARPDWFNLRRLGGRVGYTSTSATVTWTGPTLHSWPTP